MEKIKIMKEWLQSEYHMFLPEEVHNIIKEEVSDWTIVEDISLTSSKFSPASFSLMKSYTSSGSSTHT